VVRAPGRADEPERPGRRQSVMMIMIIIMATLLQSSTLI
jgi:hypothetical protein